MLCWYCFFCLPILVGPNLCFIYGLFIIPYYEFLWKYPLVLLLLPTFIMYALFYFYPWIYFAFASAASLDPKSSEALPMAGNSCNPSGGWQAPSWTAVPWMVYVMKKWKSWKCTNITPHVFFWNFACLTRLSYIEFKFCLRGKGVLWKDAKSLKNGSDYLRLER